MRYLKLLFLVVLIFKTNNVYAELNASQIAEKFNISTTPWDESLSHMLHKIL